MYIIRYNYLKVTYLYSKVMKNLEKFSYIFNLKRVEMLFAIKDGLCMSRISKRMDVTYPHLTNTFKTFKENGLIKIDKVGRESKIILTEKGKKLKILFNKIDEILQPSR